MVDHDQGRRGEVPRAVRFEVREPAVAVQVGAGPGLGAISADKAIVDRASDRPGIVLQVEVERGEGRRSDVRDDVRCERALACPGHAADDPEPLKASGHLGQDRQADDLASLGRALGSHLCDDLLYRWRALLYLFLRPFVQRADRADLQGLVGRGRGLAHRCAPLRATYSRAVSIGSPPSSMFEPNSRRPRQPGQRNSLKDGGVSL